MRWISMLLFTTLMLAYQPAPIALEANKRTDLCTITGLVVDAISGEPLRNAHLVLRSTGGRDTPSETSSDGAGVFRMKDIEPGSYHLFAEHNGYVRHEYGSRGSTRAGTILTLGPAQTLGDIIFRLTPHGVVTGRVIDEDAEPITGARIMLLRSGYAGGKRLLMPTAGGTTNDLGEYRVYGLPPGKYVISANYNPVAGLISTGTNRGRQPGVEETYAPTFYPGTNDPNSATPVDVSPGSKIQGISFALLKTRTVRIRGRVANLAGAESTAANLMINLTPKEGGPASTRVGSVQDNKGNFEFRGVPPGSYTLSATYFHGNSQYGAYVHIDVATENIEGISLDIGPGADMAGDLRVQGEADFTRRELTVVLDPRTLALPLGGASARIGEDRTFVLRNVPAGDYEISLLGMPDSCFLKSVRTGGEEVLDSGLSVRGVPANRLEVVVSTSGGSVEGFVQDGNRKPASSARVVLVPDQPQRVQARLYKNTGTDQNGHFLLQGIPPGDYKLFAWENVDAGAAQDPEFLKRFEDLGESVAIKEQERVTRQLKLIAAEGETPR